MAIFGGRSTGGNIDKVLIYDEKTDSWKEGERLPVASSLHTAALISKESLGAC